MLSYAAKPRRRWQRYVLGFVLMVLVGTGMYWRTIITNRITHLYWQHRVATSEYPKGTVVCEAFCTVPQYTPHGWYTITQLIQSHGFERIGSSFFDRYGEAAGVLVPQIQQYVHSVSPATDDSKPGVGTLYAGERTSSHGHRRIVLVTAHFDLNGPIVEVRCETVRPATLVDDRIDGYVTVPISLTFSGPYGFRAFGGQRDPADSSRFTIDYETAAEKGTIVGVLQDDRSVVFSILKR
jgi:hypothetical protein